MLHSCTSDCIYILAHQDEQKSSFILSLAAHSRMWRLNITITAYAHEMQICFVSWIHSTHTLCYSYNINALWVLFAWIFLFIALSYFLMFSPRFVEIIEYCAFNVLFAIHFALFFILFAESVPQRSYFLKFTLESRLPAKNRCKFPAFQQCKPIIIIIAKWKDELFRQKNRNE